MLRYVEPAHADHIPYLAGHLSPGAIQEIVARSAEPERVLKDSLDNSVVAWTGMVDHRPVCMFGVCPVGGLLSGTGALWFQATDELRNHGIYFLKRNPEYLKKMLDIFPHLIDFIYAEHRQVIKWVKWLGFTTDNEPVLIGPHKMPFLKFELRKRDGHAGMDNARSLGTSARDSS